MRPKAARLKTKSDDARRRGLLAECVVADFLSAKGMSIVGRNVRVGRLELDIVAREGDTIVVVEVRTRGAGAWQSGFGSIDLAKARRVREAGELLWADRFASDPTANHMRFDAAAVTFDPNGQTVVEYAAGVF